MSQIVVYVQSSNGVITTMINEKETLERFGYTSTDLTQGTNKPIVRECDMCGNLDETRFSGKRFSHCLKCACQTDAARERGATVGKARRGCKLSQDHIEALKKANTGKVDTPETTERRRNAQLGKKHTEEGKKNMSNARVGVAPWNKGVPMTEEMLLNHIATRPRGAMPEAHKKAISNGHIGKHVGEKNAMFGRTGDKSPRWLGGISYLPYCEKFDDDFKESVREKFDRTCFLCPTTEEQNGRKLSVHHVNYDKECMCNDVACEFVPLCLKCHGKTGNNRSYWETLIMDKLGKIVTTRSLKAVE